MKTHFDVAVVVPLEEEFDVVLAQFQYVNNLSTPRRVRFEVSVAGSSARILLVKQNAMGRTESAHATMDVLDEFDVGLLVCLGIAGGLSNDVNIGDVCRTGEIVDLLDNAKITDVTAAAAKAKAAQRRGTKPVSGHEVSFSPTHYETSVEVSVALDLDRLLPERKSGYEQWAAKREAVAKEHIPSEFTGKDGKKELIAAPVVRSGLIACAAVSGSTDYNKNIRKLDRKILAIETESGGMFSVAKRLSVPALTIRGISDYAGFGVDKNQFERETNNKARLVAVLNAASYLYQQISNPRIDEYLLQRRQQKPSGNLKERRNSVEELGDLLISQSEHFNDRLKELAPGFSLQGYRIPIPRVCLKTTQFDNTGTPNVSRPMELREALKQGHVLIIEVPPQYPDRSLAWIVARDLLSSEISLKQVLPCVIEARDLHRPNQGIKVAANPFVISFENAPEAQIVIVVNEFDFQSRSQTAFLLDEVNAFPQAKVIILTRNRSNVVAENEFAKKSGAIIASLDDISFIETSHFLQKNFEMTGPEAEVVAVRLRETFSNYKLSAHPSYFAGIPATTLSALLRANRRAELIELAVAGYLSFVVALDDQPVALSRKTREKFLTLLAFEIKVNKRTFTEAELIDYTTDFAKRFDFKISAVRFFHSFIEKNILFVDGGRVEFTLPFMEAYLLAKKLHEEPAEALKYFQFGVGIFDITTFMLYAEMGLADELIESLGGRLQSAIDGLLKIVKAPSILLSNKIQPALLSKNDRVRGMQKRLQKAIADVTNDSDASQEKQKLLDAAARIRVEASRQAQDKELEENEKRTIEEDALEVWSVAIYLLGAGAERLEAQTKRAFVSKIIKLSSLILDDWTRNVAEVDFKEIRHKVKEDDKLVKSLAKSDNATDLAEAERMAESLVDFLEYALLSQPFRIIVETLCEEARDGILAESIVNTKGDGILENLLRCVWLSDLDTRAGTSQLNAAIKAIPTANFLRMTLASHLITRVYWNHWDKENRLKLLHAAQECLKSSGLQYDKAGLKRLIERAEGEED